MASPSRSRLLAAPKLLSKVRNAQVPQAERAVSTPFLAIEGANSAINYYDNKVHIFRFWIIKYLKRISYIKKLLRMLDSQMIPGSCSSFLCVINEIFQVGDGEMGNG